MEQQKQPTLNDVIASALNSAADCTQQMRNLLSIINDQAKQIELMSCKIEELTKPVEATN